MLRHQVHSAKAADETIVSVHGANPARRKHQVNRVGGARPVPSAEEIGRRLGEVLTVVYLVFNEGYVGTAGVAPIRRDLARDAEWLASLLCRLLPQEPEALGLLSLIRLHSLAGRSD